MSDGLIDWTRVVDRAKAQGWNCTGERQEIVLVVIYSHHAEVRHYDNPVWSGYAATPPNRPLADLFQGAVKLGSANPVPETELLWGNVQAFIGMGMYSPAVDNSADTYVVTFDDLSDKGHELVDLLQSIHPGASLYLATYLDT